MTSKLPAGIEAAVREAVMDAIEAVGLKTFKKTSLFMSNRREANGG